MTKRLCILLTLLLGVTGLAGLNWGMMQVAQAQVIALQTPMPGPDPAVAPDIVLLNTQPVPASQHLALQVVITNVGDADMVSGGTIDRYLAYTNTFAVATRLGTSLNFAPLAVGESVTLPVSMRGSVIPGDYYVYLQISYTGDADLSNNLAGPLTVTVAADETTSDIFTTRYSFTYDHNGRLNTQNLAVMGPWSCTNMGDPFSPDASPWAPGLYTYQYRIRIPAAYPQDIVRVELFDPDSINQNGSTFEIMHTGLAQLLGMPPFETKACPASDSAQNQPCLLNTGELNLSGVTIDDINPLWFVRIDENRYGTPGTNAGCGANTYIPSNNTQTVYDLYYYTQNLDGTQQRVPLATYTGQVGDGVRDDGSHLTDMQWVAPGAPVSVGQPAAVPTNCGSPNGGDYDPITCPGGTPIGAGSGFEVDLTQDVPGLMVDPATGDRYLYLDVTAISGASENGFDIWAGPNTYVNYIFSDVNLRNLAILNNRGSHDSRGVAVSALDTLPLNSSYSSRIDIPLAEVGANYAGQTIEVSLFDSDSGARPSIDFYFDSIAFDDWHVTYTGTEGGRCQLGNCNDQWVTPSYTLTMPGNLADCDYQNPDAACIPFVGGRLMASYATGNHDNYGWQVHLPPEPAVDTSQSCAAFPLTVQKDIRSVTPPGTGANPYPDLSQFTGPPDPPAYTDFLYHHPDVPLEDAQEGDVYLLYEGFGSGNFGWLSWNDGVSANAVTLAASMTWPGNSRDYTDAGSCSSNCPTPLFPYLVRGYVNPTDNMDISLGVGDWTLSNTGVTNSNALRDLLDEHAILSRQLRLLVWDVLANPGNNGMYRVARFAVFRLAGYRFSSSSWVLLEFVRWDDSCGQLVPLAAVDVNGATTGFLQQNYTFTAAVTPTSTTQPITYTWQASNITGTITHTGGVSDTAVFSWGSWGEQVITVTAVNSQGMAAATHTITIAGTPLSDVLLDGPTTGSIGGAWSFTATAVPATATLPITYTWQASNITGTITHTGGVSDTAVFSWDSWGEQVITVTAVNSQGMATATHTITISSVPLSDVLLDGPTTGSIGGAWSFTATAVPATATLPITYTWQASNITGTITHTGGVSDTAVFSWDSWGEQVITVTAVNSQGMAAATHTITIAGTPLSDVLLDGPTTGSIGGAWSFTATAVPATATLPITYTWQASNITGTITHTGGVSDTAVFSWDSWGEQVITVTAVNLEGIPVVTTHTITITPWQIYLPIARYPD